jgi:large conductance mechanosensitive channel
MKQVTEEFKAFIIKGNAVELAIGVVIGAAFNDVVNSLVKDIILGTITTIARQPDFSELAYGAIKWGSFLNALINLMVVGLSVFVTIKIVSTLTHKEIPGVPGTTKTPATDTQHGK